MAGNRTRKVDHPSVPRRNPRWGSELWFCWFEENTNWGGSDYYPDHRTGLEIIDRNETYDQLSSELLDRVNLLPPVMSYTIGVEQFRPDLIAFDVYGFTQYWQIILEYNQIIDVGELVAGKVLKLPRLRELEEAILEFSLPKCEGNKRKSLQPTQSLIYGSGCVGINNWMGLTFDPDKCYDFSPLNDCLTSSCMVYAPSGVTIDPVTGEEATNKDPYCPTKYYGEEVNAGDPVFF